MGCFGEYSCTSYRVGIIIFTHYTPTQWSAGTKRGSAGLGHGRVGIPGDPELTPSFANLFGQCNRRIERGARRVSTVSCSNSAMRCPKPRFLSRCNAIGNRPLKAGEHFFPIMQRSLPRSISSSIHGNFPDPVRVRCHRARSSVHRSLQRDVESDLTMDCAANRGSVLV
jgi:hypothetical protein